MMDGIIDGTAVVDALIKQGTEYTRDELLSVYGGLRERTPSGLMSAAKPGMDALRERKKAESYMQKRDALIAAASPVADKLKALQSENPNLNVSGIGIRCFHPEIDALKAIYEGYLKKIAALEDAPIVPSE